MKRTISTLLIIMMLATAFSVTSSAVDVESVQSRYYSDVYSTDSYYDAVNYLYEHGVVLGTSTVTSTQKGEFSPTASLTRGQIVTFLWRMLNEPKPNGTVTTFSDCNAGTYYYNAVRWASSSNVGIITGYEDGTFKPNQGVTQQETLTFLYRFACHCAYASNTASAKNGFIDIFNSSSLANKETFLKYSKPAVGWAYQNGFITNNSIKGKDPCNRGNAAEYIYKFYEKYQKKYGLAVVNTSDMDYVGKCAAAMQTLFKHYDASHSLSQTNITQSQFAKAMETAFSKAKALDICYLYCASHGSASGLALFSGTPSMLTPQYLRTQIDKYNGTFVVFVSGCHAGTFVSTSIEEDVTNTTENIAVNAVESFPIPVTSGDLDAIMTNKDAPSTSSLDADMTTDASTYGNSDEPSTDVEDTDYFDANRFVYDLTRDEYTQESSDLRNGQRIKVLCSSRKDELSYSTDRLATYYWCLGSGYDYLNGRFVSIKADSNSDDRVSLNELYRYSYNKVVNEMPKQHIVCYPQSDNFIIFEVGF